MTSILLTLLRFAMKLVQFWLQCFTSCLILNWQISQCIKARCKFQGIGILATHTSYMDLNYVKRVCILLSINDVSRRISEELITRVSCFIQVIEKTLERLSSNFAKKHKKVLGSILTIIS